MLFVHKTTCLSCANIHQEAWQVLARLADIRQPGLLGLARLADICQPVLLGLARSHENSNFRSHEIQSHDYLLVEVILK